MGTASKPVLPSVPLRSALSSLPRLRSASKRPTSRSACTRSSLGTRCEKRSLFPHTAWPPLQEPTAARPRVRASARRCGWSRCRTPILTNACVRRRLQCHGPIGTYVHRHTRARAQRTGTHAPRLYMHIGCTFTCSSCSKLPRPLSSSLLPRHSAYSYGPWLQYPTTAPRLPRLPSSPPGMHQARM
jgi:hypothetical protein